MNKVIKEYDERGNLIYIEHPLLGYKYYQEFDEKNRLIYIRDNIVLEGYPERSYFKYINNEQIRITKEEFKQIKKEREHKEFLKRIYSDNSDRFELMDI